jgi:group I intron endonuclease
MKTLLSRDIFRESVFERDGANHFILNIQELIITLQVFMVMKGYIYCLKCPMTNEIRYIGQTILTLNKRLKSHIYETVRSVKLNKQLTHKENWILGLIKEGIANKILIELIEEVDIKDIDEREIFWIEYYKSNKLTNIDLGGKRNFLTQETKDKISKANEGENNGMFGKRFTLSASQIEINRLAMISSEKFQKSRKSKEYRDKISKIQSNKTLVLDSNTFEIAHTFNNCREVADFFGFIYCNIKHARKDRRIIGKSLKKKYYVIYEKDYNCAGDIKEYFSK